MDEGRLSKWYDMIWKLHMTCRISALTRRMSYLQQFPQSHLGYLNALLVISVYAAMTKQPPAQKCSNANSLSFAQSFYTMVRSTQMDPRMALEQLCGCCCHSPLTVKHILIDCTRCCAARQRHLGVDTLKELFENVESRNIVAFIKKVKSKVRLH